MYFKSHKSDQKNGIIKNHFLEYADVYDKLRENLLFGRKEFYSNLKLKQGGIWIEFGGGTGYTLELLGDEINKLETPAEPTVAAEGEDMTKTEARNLLAQAEGLEEQAKTMRENAYQMDESLRPKRGRPVGSTKK